MRKAYLYILSLLLLAVFRFVFTDPGCYAQEYSYINYDKKDGLPASTVYAGAQTKDGFIWLATENGLSRFDGKNFRNFSIQDGLPDNNIINVFTDSKNRLWIMPFKPELAYYYKGKIFNRNNDSLLKKLNISSFILEITEDKSGNIICVEQSAIHIIFSNGKTQTISKINNIIFITLKSGLDKYGTGRVVVSLDRNYLNTKYHFFNPLTTELTLAIPSDKYPGTSERHMITTPEFILISTPVSHASPNLFSRLYKNDQLIWEKVLSQDAFHIDLLETDKIAYNGTDGSLIYKLETGQFQYRFLPGITVNRVFVDKEKNWWFCTKESGIFQLPSTNIKTKKFYDKNTQLAVYSIVKAGKFAYFGTDRDFIWKENGKDQFLQCIVNEKKDNTARVSVLLPLKSSQIIIGSSRLRQGVISGNTIRINSFSYHTGVRSCVISKKQSLLVASTFQAVLIRLPLPNEPDSSRQTLLLERSTCAIENDSGYYIGTLKGLYYKPYDGEAILLGKKFPVLSNRITALTVAHDGTLWVATIGGGVIALKDQQIKYTITEKNGLSTNNCLSLFTVKDTVWVGTEKGLNRFTAGTNNPKVDIYTINDGLCSDVINTIFVDSNMVYAGTPKGLSYFDPGLIRQGSACDLQFTGIYVSDKYWTYDSSGFTLDHSNNDLRFEYSGISFKSGGEITYYYRLQGLHDDWRTTTDNSLSFPTLPSGNYTLQLKAINKYGIESKMKEISFSIEKLLWEKTWFRLVALAAIGLLIWAFIRSRVNKIRQREEEKSKVNQRIMELEQAALRSQINPHFIFNSLNSIQQYVVERDISGANKFITDFSHLIRMTLDYSARSSIKLSEEIHYIDTYLGLEKVRLEGKFDYSITIEEGIDPDEYTIPSLLLQPFVENSIRHGIKYRADNNGLIQLYICETEKGLLITIEDNGVGRAVANRYKTERHVQYQSKGMLLSSGRIDLLNSHGNEKIDLQIVDLYDEQSKPVGTRIELLLYTLKKN